MSDLVGNPEDRFSRVAAHAIEVFYSADYPALVVKASGLAAGKGVVVATNQEEACDAVKCILGEKKYGKAGDTVIVEELLQGEEVSVRIFFVLNLDEHDLELRKMRDHIVCLAKSEVLITCAVTASLFLHRHRALTLWQKSAGSRQRSMVCLYLR